jgi:hypothetical protein
MKEPPVGLFGRKKINDVKADVPATDDAVVSESDAADAVVAETTTDTGTGPFDRADVTEMGPRIDLGSVWIPALPGMQVRMEVDKRTNKVTGISIILHGSSLQIQAFAAPKSAGIWDDIRAEIGDGIINSGGKVDDVPGPFGRELQVQIPQSVDGKTSMRPARFIGVDGPRWFLRGVISGPAATDAKAADVLEKYFAGIVVVRDNTPRPPRDLLELTPPNAQKPADAPAAPDFDPLTRGPEITEIR